MISQKVQSSPETLASILIISNLDQLMHVRDQDRDKNQSQGDWALHYQGALQYLLACRPSSFDLSNSFERPMVRSVLTHGFWLDMAKRKRLELDSRQWRLQQDAMRHSEGPMFQTVMIFQSVPKLLEETDLLLSNPRHISSRHWTRLCQELEELKARGETELVKRDTHTIISISETSAFDMAIEEHCFITTSRTVLRFHQFPSGEAAFASAYLRIVLLTIDCTLLRIFHYVSSARECPDQRTQQDVESDAFQSAKQLCSLVYYFAKMDSLASAHVTTLLLRFARNFFEEHGAEKELGWCQACLIAAGIRIQRIQPLRPPSLCRAGELGTKLAAAARYRARDLWRGPDMT